MRLKRVYNKDAPKKEWIEVKEQDKDGNEVKRLVPPVVGVIIQHAGPRQNFSPNLVYIAQGEGWMTLAGTELTITGQNRTLVYDILRVPGRYEDGTINYYECVLKEG